MAKRSTKDCNLADELRCRKADNRHWRCRNQRAEGKTFCQYHLDKAQESYRKRRPHKCPSDEISSVTVPTTTNLTEEESSQKENNPTQGDFNDASVCAIHEIGTAEKFLKHNHTGEIRNPQIAENLIVPLKIYELDDLSAVMSIDNWHECLTPAEKYRLRSFLPNGNMCDTPVECLLSGDILRFGMNQIAQWGESVCKGKEHADTLLEREAKLKMFQSQFHNDLDSHQRTLESCAYGLIKMCSETSTCDDDKFFEQLQKLGKRKFEGTEERRIIAPKV